MVDAVLHSPRRDRIASLRLQNRDLQRWAARAHWPRLRRRRWSARESRSTSSLETRPPPPLCYLAAVDKHLRWQLGEFDDLRIKENNVAHNNIGTYTCVYTMHNTGQEHMAAVTWQPRPPAHITVRLNAALNYRYYRKFMKIMVLNAPELNAMRLRFRVEISQ